MQGFSKELVLQKKYVYKLGRISQFLEKAILTGNTAEEVLNFEAKYRMKR